VLIVVIDVCGTGFDTAVILTVLFWADV